MPAMLCFSPVQQLGQCVQCLCGKATARLSVALSAKMTELTVKHGATQHGSSCITASLALADAPVALELRSGSTAGSR